MSTQSPDLVYLSSNHDGEYFLHVQHCGELRTYPVTAGQVRGLALDSVQLLVSRSEMGQREMKNTNSAQEIDVAPPG